MKIVFLAPFGIRPKETVLARMLPLAMPLCGPRFLGLVQKRAAALLKYRKSGRGAP